jgi:uncharacterized lipoprotein YddW (UPF0748 family)
MKIFLPLQAALAASGLTLLASVASADAVANSIPPVPREFRAAWVATVDNIDWPSTRDLTTEQQQSEAIAILDKSVELNLNAIVFQIRPHADALYSSELEPWSEYLTGVQGRPPSPYYDPLEFWVTEAHRRGIELHVWFNPYRAWHLNAKSPVHETSVINTKPHIVKKLAGGYWWMDPAEPETQAHSLAVVMDVVRRYNIDGVHFDDYFYPYKSYNNDQDFPDDDSWARYQASGGTMTRNDWRRDAVNKFVKSIHEGTQSIKRHVKFGMSPFGIWRPGHPPTITGLDQYDVLFADAKLWLNEGWVDYYTPQLYWPISLEPHSFPVLLAWWVKENTKGVHMWPGLGTFRAGDARWGDSREVLNQIQITRALVPEAPGQVHFSFKHFMEDTAGVATALKNGPYRRQALVPASPWMDDEPPAAPTVTIKENTVEWTPNGNEDAFLWVVHRREGSTWQYEILPAQTRSYELPKPADEKITVDNIGGGTQTQTRQASPITHVAVTAVDRVGNESTRTVVAVSGTPGG